MVKRLFFEINPGRIFQYTVHSFKHENGFYSFTDIKDHKERSYHESLYRGVEDA